MKPYQAVEYLKLELPEDLHPRLDRAFGILQGLGYVIEPTHKDLYTIKKLSTSYGGDLYSVYLVNISEDKARSCTCPDYPTVRAGLCKHILATKLYELVEDTTDHYE